jgi:hypothetical protein
MIQLWLVRIAPYLIISAGVLAIGFAAGAWIKEQGRKELRPVIERLQTELDNERENRKRNEAALNGYQSELAALRKRTVNRTPVRLCIDGPVQDDAAGSVDGSTAAAGSGAGSARGNHRASADIGPALRELAYDCDAENAKLRALQKWLEGK